MELKTSDEESALNEESSPSSQSLRLNSFPSSSSTRTWERDPLSIVSSIRTSQQSLVFSIDQEEAQQRRSIGCRSIFSSIFLFFGGIVSFNPFSLSLHCSDIFA